MPRITSARMVLRSLGQHELGLARTFQSLRVAAPTAASRTKVPSAGSCYACARSPR